MSSTIDISKIQPVGEPLLVDGINGAVQWNLDHPDLVLNDFPANEFSRTASLRFLERVAYRRSDGTHDLIIQPGTSIAVAAVFDEAATETDPLKRARLMIAELARLSADQPLSAARGTVEGFRRRLDALATITSRRLAVISAPAAGKKAKPEYQPSNPPRAAATVMADLLRWHGISGSTPNDEWNLHVRKGIEIVSADHRKPPATAHEVMEAAEALQFFYETCGAEIGIPAETGKKRIQALMEACR